MGLGRCKYIVGIMLAHCANLQMYGALRESSKSKCYVLCICVKRHKEMAKNAIIENRFRSERA